MDNKKSMNDKNTMNILALKLLKEFFQNPCTKPCAIHWEDVPIPSTSEIELFESYGIKSDEEFTKVLLKLWISIDSINYCVNDKATCTNCDKELDEHWKCCSHCSNAICSECYECEQCDDYNGYDRCENCGVECGAYMCGPCEQYEDYKEEGGRCQNCGVECGAYMCTPCKQYEN